MILFGGFRQKLYVLIVGVVMVFGIIAAVTGTTFIQSMTLAEAQTRVQNNLRSAWAVVEAEQERIQQTIQFLGRKESLITAIKEGTIVQRHARLTQIRHDADLDFLTVTDRKGRVLLRTTTANAAGDDVSADIFVRDGLMGKTLRGIHLLPPERLDLEGELLSRKAYLHLVATPHAKPREQVTETYGMALIACGPVTDEHGVVIGCVYGGVLLNRNYPLVDKIRAIVFGDETYEGRAVGTVTLFQWDVRISTNVMTDGDLRAIGTRVSEEVYDRTLENGLPWVGRAFVVRDWYITAYDPIRDLGGEIVGMLYVGALEKKYSDMKTKMFLFFNALSLLWIVIVLVMVTQISKKFITPIFNLAGAARRISSGAVDVEVPPVTGQDEIRELTEAFRSMLAAVREREEALTRANLKLTATNENYMEMLSFVSHELKNRIAGSAIAVHTLQRNTSGLLEADEAHLLDQLSATLHDLAEMLRNYLDLARLESHQFAIQQREIAFVPEVVLPTLDRLAVLSDSKNVLIKNQNEPSVRFQADPQLLNVIYYNLVHNAVKFCPQGGMVRLATHERPDGIHIEIWNEGEGIPEALRERVFEKFYKASEAGAHGSSGSGLGLFITKTLVEMQGGAITVESKEGRWTRFCVRLPREGSRRA